MKDCILLSRSKQRYIFFPPTDLRRKAPYFRGLAGALAAVWHRLERGRLLQLLLLVMVVVLLVGLTVTGSTRSKREAETKDGVHLPGWAELLDGSLRSATETRS